MFAKGQKQSSVLFFIQNTDCGYSLETHRYLIFVSCIGIEIVSCSMYAFIYSVKLM